MKWAIPILCALAGAAGGWFAARQVPAGTVAEAPADWIARVDDEYISSAAFVDEMRRRGGLRPGQFQDLAQKRALLDELLFRRAVVKAARAAGIDRDPELVRAAEQVLVNRYLRQNLDQLQREVVISDAEVRAHYEADAARYAVPARRRLAVIRIEVPSSESGLDWGAAEAEAGKVLTLARALPQSVPHFGALAQEYSSEGDSRWRGGVIGWLAESVDVENRPGLDPEALRTGLAISEAGDMAGPVRGADAVWLVRLVDRDGGRGRSFEELAAGIRQGLHQQRLSDIEAELRSRTLAAVHTEVREPQLAAIEPVAPPADEQPPQPPALPGERG